MARFEGGVQATSEGYFRYTYRFALKDAPEQWQWLGQEQDDGHLKILPPSEDMLWTQGPHYAEVAPGGNFITASDAARLRFDTVLNMAEELTLLTVSCPVAMELFIPLTLLSCRMAWSG